MTIETQTIVPLVNAKEVFVELSKHIVEHGLEENKLTDSHTQFFYENCRLDFSHDEARLFISLNAPNENMLFFMKEAIAAHVVEINEEAGTNLRWDGEAQMVAGSGRPVNFRELSVVKKSEVYPGMIRLTLKGENIESLASDGLHVKLMRPANSELKEPVWPSVAANGMTIWPKDDNELHVRYFTLRNVRLDDGEVDIDVVQHAGGMIADWAIKAEKGDIIGVMGPGGGAVPLVEKTLLIAGDETALPAIARILEALPKHVTGYCVIAMPAGLHHEDYLPKTNLEVIIVTNDSFDEGCVETCEALDFNTQKPDFGWFAGEFNTANAMRNFFKDILELKKGHQFSVSYWERGKRGRADKVD